MILNDKKIKFCIYDTETTGLDVLTESILEMAFIDYDSGKKIYHEYIYPSNCKKITNSFIHKIDETVLKEKNALSIEDALNKLNQVFQQFYEDSLIILVAHNNFGYDQLILESEYQRINKNICKNVLFFDTLPFFRKIFPDLNSYKLGNIYNHYFKNNDNSGDFHTATYDTICLYNIFKYALSKLKSKKILADCKYLRASLSIVKTNGDKIILTKK